MKLIYFLLQMIFFESDCISKILVFIKAVHLCGRGAQLNVERGERGERYLTVPKLA